MFSCQCPHLLYLAVKDNVSKKWQKSANILIYIYFQKAGYFFLSLNKKKSHNGMITKLRY